MSEATLLAGVIGDDHPEIKGYPAIELALKHAAAALAVRIEVQWLTTRELEPDCHRQLGSFDALWCGPHGPYANSEGALRAIRFAREQRRPFLGTCAGFQHAAIEYARSVLGLVDADHAEMNPTATLPLVAALTEPRVERCAAVILDPASRTARIYGRTEIAERYRCHFGLNPEYVGPLHRGGLRVAGIDEDGNASVIEFPEHPFFVGTLFLPERASRLDAPHPLVTAYLKAAAETSEERR